MTMRGLATKWMGLLAVMWAAAGFGCGETGSDSSTETNWLKACSSDGECGGLDCVCGVCSQECEELADCTRADQARRCAPPGDPAECDRGERTICLPDSDLSGAGGDGSGGDGSINATGATGGTSASGSGGSGGGEEPAECSNDADCGELEYCDFIDDLCGTNGETGNCVPFPLECSPGPQVCRCDGEITSCDVTDRSRAGDCETALGQLACGELVCSSSTEVCVTLDVEDPSEDEVPSLPYHGCWGLISTQGCEGQVASCDCLDVADVCNRFSTGSQFVACDELNAGEVTVSCLNPSE